MFFPIAGNFAEVLEETSLPHLAARVSHFPTGLIEKHQSKNQKFYSLTYPPLPPSIIRWTSGRREDGLLSPNSGQEESVGSLFLCLNRPSPGWTKGREWRETAGLRGAVEGTLYPLRSAWVSSGGRGTWKVTRTDCLSDSPPQKEPPAGWGIAAPSARTIALHGLLLVIHCSIQTSSLQRGHCPLDLMLQSKGIHSFGGKHGASWKVHLRCSCYHCRQR